MKAIRHNVLAAFLLLIGVFLGSSGVYVYFYFGRDRLTALDHNFLRQLIAEAKTRIPAKNWHCESADGNSVGEVIGSMIAASLSQRINRLSFQCSSTNCLFTVDDCYPWQSNECGSRQIRFETHDGSIVLSSLSCTDVP